MEPSDNRNLLQRCLDGASGPRAWTSTSQCLSDHFAFAASHYDLLGAYTGIGAPSIEPPLVEAIMVAVNSVNQCPYCDGLHGELGGEVARLREADARHVEEHLQHSTAHELIGGSSVRIQKGWAQRALYYVSVGR